MDKTPGNTLARTPVSWHKCDTCRNNDYVIYISQLDKWYCIDCIQVVCELLDEFFPASDIKN